MTWKPNVTVAVVLEHQGQFLVVEEHDQGMQVYNQPAGHLEPGESLVEAAVRETLEETARAFEPEALTGIYRWTHPGKDLTFLRFCFTGRYGAADPGRSLDPDIVATAWLDRDTLESHKDRLRSPMVLRCIDDYRAGQRYPLTLLHDLQSGWDDA